jgi:hypothetical protein
MKNNKERKINIIKALKRENAFLKCQSIKPLRIYETDLKHQRVGYFVSDRFKTIYGEEMALNIAKNEIGYQFRAFLDECELEGEDNGITTRYYFNFWTE